MRRRTLLQATAGGLAAAVAGCTSRSDPGNEPPRTNTSSDGEPARTSSTTSGEPTRTKTSTSGEPTHTKTSTTTRTDPSDTDSDIIGYPRGLHLRNEDDTAHELSVQLTTDEESVFEGTYEVPAESHVSVEDVVAEKRTYTLDARTGGGEQDSYTLELSESVLGIQVEIRADGTVSAYDVVSEGSWEEGAKPSYTDNWLTLPYTAADPAENFGDPRGLVITNECDGYHEIEIQITDGSTSILERNYWFTTDTTLVVPDIIDTAGVYSVDLTVKEMGHDESSGYTIRNGHPVEVPREDTSESASFDWHVSETRHEVEVHVSADREITVLRSRVDT